MTSYKVLTLTQPYATLIAIGAKRLETRSWATSYRGPLLIHAAAGLGPVGGRAGLYDLAFSDPDGYFYQVLKRAEIFCIDDLPRGAIVAVCKLRNIARIDYFEPNPDDYAAQDWEGPFLNFGSRGEALPDEPELSFGDYTPGRYAWLLADVKRLKEPIPAKGALGLWTWQGDLPS